MPTSRRVGTHNFAKGFVTFQKTFDYAVGALIERPFPAWMRLATKSRRQRGRMWASAPTPENEGEYKNESVSTAG